MRAANRVLTIVLAIGLAGFGVLVILEICRAALNLDEAVLPWQYWRDLALRNTWGDVGPRIAAGVLIAIGLLLAVFALRRGRPATLPLADRADHVVAETTRRSLAKALSDAVEAIEGVDSPRIVVKRRKIKVKSGTALYDDSELPTRIQDRVDAFLKDLSLARPLRVSTRVKTGSGAKRKASHSARRRAAVS